MPTKPDLPSCYIGGGESERGERDVARRHTYSCKNVLEIGGGAGSVSAIVQQELRHKERHVVVQPKADGMFGGFTQLMKNRKACDMKFTVIDHKLVPTDVDLIQTTLGSKPDCMVVDCENCLGQEYNKNPSLFDDLRLLQVERDDRGSYDALFKKLKLRKVDEGMGCGTSCKTEVWVRDHASM